ncbi:MAG: fatty acid desaturase [Armatimonadetes bacterium]|nr:fatty acid desaturase [Armatimonadota bacterium]
MEVPHPWDWPTAAVLGTVHSGALLAPFFFDWSAILVALVLYAVTSMGITLGYHRLLTHRSYKTVPFLEYFFTFWASQAGQGGPISWTAVHRLHHKRSDQEGDPHGAHRGFWWSHMGWMLTRPPHKLDPQLKTRLAPDLEADPVHCFLDRNWLLFIVGMGFLLLQLGGWSWVIWGMFVRLVLVYHATWLVNSAAHKFGYRTHATRDLSTNCWWVAAVTFGEGWHNNHHAFPYSARHGLAPWEFDLSWGVIRLLERFGLAWDLKVARPQVSRSKAS